MRRTLLTLGALLALAGSTGCVVAVQERRPPPPYGVYCPGWVWVPGHYGPYGAWHRGHWRCG